MNTAKYNSKNTLTIAHRGLSGLEVENTNAAFVAAANRSYYGIETDIHRTGDGHFVVMHDSNLMRVSGEDVDVEKTALSDILNVVLFDKNGEKSRADLRPSTLENYISICKKYDKHCILELKSDFTDEETARFIDIIKELDYLGSVTFISFIYENLIKVRRILPEQSAQFLFSTVTDEIIERLKRDRLDADVNFNALTKENIEKMHSMGIKVNAWTVNNRQIAETLADFGIDYITTNILE